MSRDDSPVGRSPSFLEFVEYRVTYEEQCAHDRDHHNVSFSAMNTPLEDVMAVDGPIADKCPRCGAAVIAMSNMVAVN